MRPALVIFDCDGVLVDTETPFHALISADFTARGAPLTPAQSRAMFTGARMTQMRQWAIEQGAQVPEDWAAQFRQPYWARLRQGVAAIPHIHQALDALDAADLPYCVASNGPVAQMEITLGQTGLWDRFAGRIFSAYEVGVHKPDPGLFLHAAAAMGAAPERALVIEDSVTGLTAAKAAGMRALAYVHEAPDPAAVALASGAFDDMQRLPGIILV